MDVKMTSFQTLYMLMVKVRKNKKVITEEKTTQVRISRFHFDFQALEGLFFLPLRCQQGKKWKNFDCPLKYTITFVKELLAMKKLQRDLMKVVGRPAVCFLKILSGQDLVNGSSEAGQKIPSIYLYIPMLYVKQFCLKFDSFNIGETCSEI